jgi:hypothetical protein
LLNPSVWAASLLGLVTLILAASVLLAIFRKDEQRAYWIGFACFGWLYLLLCFGTVFDGPLGPSRLITGKIATALHELVSAESENPTNPTDPFSDLFAQQVESRARADFLVVSHTLWTILLALLGGTFARWLYHSRNRPIAWQFPIPSRRQWLVTALVVGAIVLGLVGVWAWRNRASPGPPQPLAPAQSARGHLGANVDDYGPNFGVHVVRVRPGSPAAAGGLRDGDIISSINGVPCRNLSDLNLVMAQATVGSELSIVVTRYNQQVRCVVTLGRNPNEQIMPPLP